MRALLDSKTVFTHVPKCGGKSVITGLYARDMEMIDSQGGASI